MDSIIGKRFGKLTVEKKTNDIYKKYYLFECRCECGTIVRATKHQLRNKQSCGCLVAAKTVNRLSDYVGKKSHKLTVIDYDIATKKLKCVCECGQTMAVRARDFGKTQSCGCISRTKLITQNDIDRLPLSDKEKSLLIMIDIDRNTIVNVARKLGLTKQAVSEKRIRILKKHNIL